MMTDGEGSKRKEKNAAPHLCRRDDERRKDKIEKSSIPLKGGKQGREKCTF